jgi:hypothetical protein
MKSIRNILGMLIFIIALGMSSAHAQPGANVTLQSAATANGNGTEFLISGNSAVALTVNCVACAGGTTVNFEGTEDGTNYSAVSATQVGTTATTGTSTTTSGITVWQLSGAGLVKIRARISAYSAGTITVTGHAIPAALGIGRGGGVSTAAAVVALFSGCSGVQYLGADGACHAASGGFAAPTNWAKDGTNANDFVNTVTESVTGNQSLYKTTWTHTNTSLASGNNIKGEDNSGTITVTAVANTTVAPFAYNIHTINLVSGNLTHAFEFVNRVTGKSTAGQQIDQLTSGYFSLGTSALAGPLPLARIVDVAADAIDTSVTIGEFDFLATGAPAAITGGGGVTTFAGVKSGDFSVPNVGTNYCMICSGGTPVKKVSLFVYAGTPSNLDNMAIFETGSPVQMKGGLIVSAAVNTVLGLFSGEDANDTFGVVVNGQNSFHFSYDGTGAAEWGICHAVSSSFCIRRPGAGINDLVIDRTSGLIKMLNYGPVNLMVSSTAPTISSGFGTSPSVASNNGTAAFTINVGTGGSATSGVIGLPTATNGWVCHAQDLTTNSATVFVTKQTASSTTTATIGNFNTSGAAAAWVASDILHISCSAR